MKKPSMLRKAIGVVTSVLLALSWFSPMQVTLRELPDTLVLTQGQISTLLLGGLRLEGDALTVTSSTDESLSSVGAVNVVSQSVGTSDMLLSLLGIPLKKVEVHVSPEKRLIPGGQALGVAMRTEGVLIVGVSDVAEGVSPAKAAGLLAGDIITGINGTPVATAEGLTEQLNSSGPTQVRIAYRRAGENRTVLLTPHRDEVTGAVRLGAWVRDSTAGVGTLSFFDPETKRYAALGHAITDGDTGAVLSVSEGQVLRASIVAVQKGQKGAPGELKGSFLREGEVLGDIRRNSILGIYGTMAAAQQNPLYPEGLPIGLRSGVHTGTASILSSVDGTGVHEYAVEITRVNQQTAPAPKSMVLHVTDERLLNATGGIVQGMSGSPILQDGRIIGAVTHVFVNDPTQGYGVYIDWMLEEAAQV
ncbi:MAG: SpoIVB peptidase [Clostridiales bacterium]|nr:SpoIVB peptidase [Clostridiales bacterium]